MARLAAIVVAAGASRRFGADNKLLARFNDRPLVRCVAEATLAAGLADVVVVTGCDAPLIEDALTALPVRFVPNETWESGLGSSVAAGVGALGEEIEGAFVVPADMPLLTADLLLRLASVFDAHGGQRIIYPATPDGAQRSPVLWPRSFFPRLKSLAGAQGAKPLLQALKERCVAVPVDDVAILADVDTPEALAIAHARSGRT